MSVIDVDTDPVEVPAAPVSTDGRFLFRELRRTIEDVALRLDRRTRRIRDVLVRHDERLDNHGARLDAHAERLGDLEGGARALLVDELPASGPRGVLALVDGDDAFLYIGLGQGRPIARVALEEVPE